MAAACLPSVVHQTSHPRPARRRRIARGGAALAALLMLAGACTPTAVRRDAPAAAAGPTPTLTLDLGHNVTMDLVLIPAGRFQMGSPDHEHGREEDEGPLHEVTIAQPFYMARTEVTQAQWQAVMGTNPSASTGDANRPVEMVTWDDCQAFCQKLSERAGRAVRLPTEAEWEYACRAGTTTRYSFGDDPDGRDLGHYGWFADNSGQRPLDGTTLRAKGIALYVDKIMANGCQPRPVGQKQPNAWGLYDLHGNVAEMCADVKHDSYAGAPADGSASLAGADPRQRIARGGSWSVVAAACRSAGRRRTVVGHGNGSTGFRPVAAVAPASPAEREAWAAPQRARQRQIAQALDAAKAHDRDASTQPALQALDQVLRLEPGHPEAVALRHKVLARYGLAPQLTLDLGNNVTLDLVPIGPGTFRMGSPEDEDGGLGDEGPVRTVTIAQPFYLARTEVTQAQWRAVMGTNPSAYIEDENLPVESVTWEDCQAFCRKLSERTGRTVRLPTEAEWEYACRAGATTRFSFGDDPLNTQLDDYAWFANNSGNRRIDATAVAEHALQAYEHLILSNGCQSHPVGLKRPNAWGLYDLHGNVAEWCADAWHLGYEGAPTDGRAWTEDPETPARVMRGGDWGSPLASCQSATRHAERPGQRRSTLGFRPVVTLAGGADCGVARPASQPLTSRPAASQPASPAAADLGRSIETGVADGRIPYAVVRHLRTALGVDPRVLPSGAGSWVISRRTEGGFSTHFWNARGTRAIVVDSAATVKEAPPGADADAVRPDYTRTGEQTVKDVAMVTVERTDELRICVDGKIGSVPLRGSRRGVYKLSPACDYAAAIKMSDGAASGILLIDLTGPKLIGEIPLPAGGGRRPPLLALQDDILVVVEGACDWLIQADLRPALATRPATQP